MGLFRKKKEDNTQLDSLRTELESMRDRLDGADRVNADLETRLTTLDQSNANFEHRFEKIESASEVETKPLLVSTPTPPPPPPPADEGGAGVIDEGKLDEIASQLEELSTTVAAHYTELSSGREQMDAVDGLNERFGEIAEQVSTVDLRVTNVSFELANQLTELSRDIEAISEQRGASTEQPSANPSAAIDERIDSALDNVRETTQKLAAEQARYEIQFREDLADLADRLRRPGER